MDERCKLYPSLQLKLKAKSCKDGGMFVMFSNIHSCRHTKKRETRFDEKIIMMQRVMINDQSRWAMGFPGAFFSFYILFIDIGRVLNTRSAMLTRRILLFMFLTKVDNSILTIVVFCTSASVSRFREARSYESSSIPEWLQPSSLFRSIFGLN